ncbi:MAG TPA: STAS domain-containing protein [Blastocatellia bacterium]|nr:STAS domain-containing protein [Blastocatellia bacterium]
MSGTDIRSKLIGDAAVIYPGSYLNQLRGETIERRCLELISEGVRNLVINFQETELINSIGISMLMGVIEAVNRASGTLVLSNLSATNRELFQVLGLLSHVEVFDTEEVALTRLLTPFRTAIG